MKKTLIALAAVAVTSTAMAQVTMSGAISWGFDGDTSALGVTTNGYGTNTAKIAFAASEDLGGGLKLNGSMFIDNLVEGTQADGGNVVIGLTGGFGSIQMSSAESGDFLPIDGLTANSNGTDADRISWTLPAMVPGLTLQLTTQDGTSIAGATRGESVTSYVANYTTGPMSFNVLYADFATASIDNRTGFKATYDLGMAKVSYGQLNHNVVAANSDVTETGFTVSTSVANFALALNRSTSKTGTLAKRTGNSFSASYPLSKRTSISYYTESYLNAIGDVSNTKESNLLLNHTF
jgi:hypothetical protein